MQIGKDYPFLETRKPETAGLIRQLKAVLDPSGLMNPGALGLD
jgi:D-lactate dehydrogenase (cytochrome)